MGADVRGYYISKEAPQGAPVGGCIVNLNMTRGNLYRVKNDRNKILIIVLQVAIHTKQFPINELVRFNNSISDITLRSSALTGLQIYS